MLELCFLHRLVKSQYNFSLPVQGVFECHATGSLANISFFIFETNAVASHPPLTQESESCTSYLPSRFWKWSCATQTKPIWCWSRKCFLRWRVSIKLAPGKFNQFSALKLQNYVIIFSENYIDEAVILCSVQFSFHALDFLNIQFKFQPCLYITNN